MTSQLRRSFLFVPAANERLLKSAISKPADVVILDLEDGTHSSQKEAARAALAASIALLSDAGKGAAVRINSGMNAAVTDLRAAVRPGLDVVLLPKVEHARDVQLLSEVIAELEAAAGVEAGHVRFLIQIESAVALPRLYEIASADPRVMGMMLGSEDFSLDCGGLPTPEALMAPSLMLLYAARAARIQPIGFVGSIAELGEPEEFRRKLDQARSLGFRGAVVVHPKFVDAINECYTASPDQITRARRIVSEFEAADAQGLGAIRVDGTMIDKPVYMRALALLDASQAAAS
ncbi:CoA ester lyase [Variovorax sp. J22R133]|uniref:HpcH/HpaI aldolase/citrate lyase family protein n=1 Tax=Variovorax brevis TaxID=3053503 RepID=UPI0025751934|nr:CoA ester lyase [Variovorax sp. J22R133]MDM0116036.1 CoA ester lyase [Variovorax sp. J22R133]